MLDRAATSAWRPPVARIDAVLDTHAAAIGRDLLGYRHHAYRMASFCLALSPADPIATEKVAIAAALHDVGIWTAGTFDYLEPSARAAVAYLDRVDRAAWAPEITAMIREHHRITPSRAPSDWLVEPFRKADLVDLSRGLVTFGLPHERVRAALAQWPSAGFHRRLVQLTLERLRTHPWSPLPMLRL